MEFKIYDFLIYSSHKTSTQTLVQLLCSNYNVVHIHNLYNLNIKNDVYKNIRNNKVVSAKNFIQGLVKYKNQNNKKIKIITAIRNPKDRLLSSFFQIYNDDEVFYLNKKPEKSTVSLGSEEELICLYKNLIKTKTLPLINESIDELSYIFNTNIINSLEKKDNYYYFNHDLFELFVLDFNKLIQPDANIYLNNILNINVNQVSGTNLSINKSYYNKYVNVKKKLSEENEENKELITNITTYFNSFYFTAFQL